MQAVSETCGTKMKNFGIDGLAYSSAVHMFVQLMDCTCFFFFFKSAPRVRLCNL